MYKNIKDETTKEILESLRKENILIDFVKEEMPKDIFENCHYCDYIILDKTGFMLSEYRRKKDKRDCFENIAQKGAETKKYCTIIEMCLSNYKKQTDDEQNEENGINKKQDALLKNQPKFFGEWYKVNPIVIDAINKLAKIVHSEEIKNKTGGAKNISDIVLIEHKIVFNEIGDKNIITNS